MTSFKEIKEQREKAGHKTINQFYENLNKYVIYEKILTPYLEKIFDSKLKSYCNTKSHDIELGNNIKIEIKIDVYSKKSGNVFIEYKKDNKDSGIIASQSKYYVIGQGDYVYYLIRTKRLRKLINDGLYKFKLYSKFNNSSGYMLPFENIINNASKVINITNDDFNIIMTHLNMK